MPIKNAGMTVLTVILIAEHMKWIKKWWYKWSLARIKTNEIINLTDNKVREKKSYLALFKVNITLF